MAMAKLTQSMKDTLIEIAEYHSVNPTRKFSATRFNKSSLKAICKQGYIKFDEQELYFTVSQKGVGYLKEIFPDLSFDNSIVSNIVMANMSAIPNDVDTIFITWANTIVILPSDHVDGCDDYIRIRMSHPQYHETGLDIESNWEYVGLDTCDNKIYRRKSHPINPIDVDMNNIAKLFAFAAMLDHMSSDEYEGMKKYVESVALSEGWIPYWNCPHIDMNNIAKLFAAIYASS